jgi:hypothetical protein
MEESRKVFELVDIAELKAITCVVWRAEWAAFNKEHNARWVNHTNQALRAFINNIDVQINVLIQVIDDLRDKTTAKYVNALLL